MPLLAGAFLTDANQREQWTPFWLTTAAIMGCSGVIFLVFGETRRQDFSLDAPDAPAAAECAFPAPPGGKQAPAAATRRLLGGAGQESGARARN